MCVLWPEREKNTILMGLIINSNSFHEMAASGVMLVIDFYKNGLGKMSGEILPLYTFQVDNLFNVLAVQGGGGPSLIEALRPLH